MIWWRPGPRQALMCRMALWLMVAVAAGLALLVADRPAGARGKTVDKVESRTVVFHKVRAWSAAKRTWRC